MDNLFNKLGLEESVVKGLEKMKIVTPTEIQEKTIPVALENKDIIAQSETGTGKTLAYLLPIFQKIDASKKEMQSIILAPTHELAVQIQKQIELLAQSSGIPVTSMSIIGNVNIKRQVDKLKEKPHIIVGSAGRILELIKMKKITAHLIKTIVLDEGDRLVDQNNIDDVKAVIKSTLRERQIMLFSATVTENTVSLAKELMKEAEVIRIAEKNTVNTDISHMYFVAEQRDKILMLRKLVHSVKPQRAIVFINKSDEIEIMVNKLNYHGLKCDGIYGAAIKADRKKALDDFKSGKIQLLVASDIAARGLDIKGVTHIFNLDIPENPKDYLHRAGRTGRAGEKGCSISIITERELQFIKLYEKEFKISINPKEVYMGRIKDGKEPKINSKKPIYKKDIKENKVEHKSDRRREYNTSYDDERDSDKKDYRASDRNKDYSKKDYIKKDYNKKPYRETSDNYKVSNKNEYKGSVDGRKENEKREYKGDVNKGNKNIGRSTYKKDFKKSK